MFHLPLYFFLSLLSLSVTLSKIQENSLITFFVSENISVGGRVGSVDLALNSSQREASEKTTSQLTYSLQDNTYFNFDAKEPGWLLVQTQLDRDNDRRLCNENGWPRVCVWSGVLFISDGRMCSLRVVVEDVNDNVPSWWPGEDSRQYHLNASVTENCPIGTPIDLPMASDPDIGENSIVRYEVKLVAEKNETNPFELINLTGQNGVAFRLVVRGHLDREQQSVYELLLMAIDGGGLTGTARLYIKMNDENDNPPIFTHLKGPNPADPFVVIVGEDLPVGTHLNRHPVATDADEGKFGELTYRFALSTSDLVKRDFSIDSRTGSLVLRRALDSDAGGVNQYAFTVTVEDQGSPSLTASAKVVIKVRDCNDNAPQITITSAYLPEDLEQTDHDDHIQSRLRNPVVSRGLLSPEDKRVLRLVEEAPAGRLVATVTVHDPDSGADGKFACQLLEGAEGDGRPKALHLTYLRQLGKLSVYHLVSIRGVDRESQPEINAMLVCEDEGARKQVARERITVVVLDINDHAPRFSGKHHSFQTHEGDTIGQTVGRFTVEDADEGINAQVHFAIEWPEHQGINPFFMSNDGQLMVQIPLDREDYPEGYRFTVTAIDYGKPPLSSSTSVEVSLIDINDCTPTFSQPLYQFSIEEELAPQTPSSNDSNLVGHVKASDCDVGANSRLSFQIEPSGTPFRIDESGYIYATSSLDREITPDYTFMVFVKDLPHSPMHSLTSFCQVHVTVLDINDHSPIFIRPPFENNTNQVELSSQETRGHQITILKVTDDDIGSNAEVQYILVNGVNSEYFYLHPKTGGIFLKRDAREMNSNLITLQALAIDNGQTARTSSASVVVKLTDSPSAVASGYTPRDSRRGGNLAMLSSLKSSNPVLVISIAVISLLVLTVTCISVCVLVHSRRRMTSQKTAAKASRATLIPSTLPYEEFVPGGGLSVDATGKSPFSSNSGEVGWSNGRRLSRTTEGCAYGLWTSPGLSPPMACSPLPSQHIDFRGNQSNGTGAYGHYPLVQTRGQEFASNDCREFNGEFYRLDTPNQLSYSAGPSSLAYSIHPAGGMMDGDTLENEALLACYNQTASLARDPARRQTGSAFVLSNAPSLSAFAHHEQGLQRQAHSTIGNYSLNGIEQPNVL